MSGDEDLLRLAGDKWVPAAVAEDMIRAVAPPRRDAGWAQEWLEREGGTIRSRPVPGGMSQREKVTAARRGRKVPAPGYERNLADLILRLLAWKAVQEWPVPAEAILGLATLDPAELPTLTLQCLMAAAPAEGCGMPRYSWQQMIRVLAGRDAGHPDIPDTGVGRLDLKPAAVISLLADGVAEMWGVPDGGDSHEPVPAAAWRRIRIEFRLPRSNHGLLRTLAVLPGEHPGEVPAGRSWRELQVPGRDLTRLKAALARLAETSRPEGRHAAHGTVSSSSAPSSEKGGSAFTTVPFADAAARIAALNPAETASRLLARLTLTQERGALTATEAGGHSGSSAASVHDLACWCRYRRLVCPSEWLPEPSGDNEPLASDQDPDPYITPQEAAQWLAWHAEDPVESVQWAIDEKILPTLQGGHLEATGREGCVGVHRKIPQATWTTAEFNFGPPKDDKKHDYEGDTIWLRYEPGHGPIWDQVLFDRPLFLRLWPERQYGPISRSSTPSTSNEKNVLDGGLAPTKHNLTLKAERDCKTWLVQMMKASPNSPRRKQDVRSEAFVVFDGLGVRAFDRTWTYAVEAAEAEAWSRAGTKKRRKSIRDAIPAKS